MTEEILGVRFDVLTVGEATDKALSLIRERRCAVVCTPNPETVWKSRGDPALRAALRSADMVLPDGIGIVWASGVLGGKISERASGFDFFVSLLEKLRGTVYLLGGRPGVAADAARVIAERWKNVTVVGTHDGYFSDDEPVFEEIKRTKPDFVAVCLGVPGQELWMRKAADAGLPAGLMAGLGGSLDVLSGRTKRAPRGWINCRLEWLYRLLCQPTRIKRQLCLPLFAAVVLGERIKHGKRKAHCP